jgi:hypothetical protein
MNEHDATCVAGAAAASLLGTQMPLLLCACKSHLLLLPPQLLATWLLVLALHRQSCPVLPSAAGWAP